jgi:hypothetical protein
LLASLVAYARRHHVAYLALLVALGGTAYALERNSVTSRHIKDGQVRPQDLGLVKVVERAGPDTISSSGSAIKQDFTVKVPEPGLLAVFAEGEILQTDGGAVCGIGVVLPGSSSTRPLIQRSFDTNGNFAHLRSAPGTMASGDDAGTGFESDAGFVVFNVDAGRLEGQLSLTRALTTGCTFRNVELHLMPLT